MKTKNLKIIKLSLALASAAIFFFGLVFMGDSEYSINFLGLYISQFSFYFLLGLIIVLILEIANYFSINEVFNVIANIIALFIVVCFIVKLFSETIGFDGINPYVRIHMALLLPILMQSAIFLLDKKFKIN